MKENFKLYENIAYTVLVILFIIIFFTCFNYKKRITPVQNLSFRSINSNKEGFIGNDKLKENKYNENSVYKLLENKLRGLTEEIGGEKGKREITSLLINTKKILNLECAKCMINMIDDNTKSKTIDIDNLIDNENNVNCNRCKKFTELSDTITSLIDNLSIKK